MSDRATPSVTKVAKRIGRFALHRTVLNSHPKVLCNSIHKAGTHLLVAAVSGVPGLHHYGRAAYWHYLSRTGIGSRSIPTPGDVKGRLAGCLPAEILRGHIGHHQVIGDALQAGGFKHLLIYRDPRDVVVSHFFWWTRRARDAYWPYRFFESLDSDEDRLSFLIMGWPDGLDSETFPSRVNFPDIGTRVAEFLPWLQDPGCLGVRFEDLVSQPARPRAYRRIAEYLFPQASSDFIFRALSRMSVTTDPARSKTFRKGSVGEWRRYFSETHVSQFKDRCGHLLVSLGYEKDFDW